MAGKKILKKTDKTKKTAVHNKTKDKNTNKTKSFANIKDGKELAEEIKKNINKTNNRSTINHKNRKKYYTHSGHELTIKEYKFIDNYIRTGNVSLSVKEAGYVSKAPSVHGNNILQKGYIADEIEYLMTQEHEKRIADGNEVMEFYSKVMRGEVKDQFELEAPLSERLKAANELAKRTVDIANKVAGITQGQNEVTIKLDFDRNSL